MKTTPLLTLAVTVIAVMLLNSCNLISGRHYSLNLVKVEKNKVEKSNSFEIAELKRQSQNSILAEKELHYVSFEKPIDLNKEKHSNSSTSAVLNSKEAVEKISTSNLSKPFKSAALSNEKHNHYIEKSTNNKPWDKLTVITFIFAILSLLLTLPMFFIGIFLGLPIFFLGLKGISRTKNNSRKGYWMAVANTCLGIFLFLFPIVMVLSYIISTII